MGRRRRRARPARPAGQQPAPDAAGIRGDSDPDRDGRGALCAGRSRGAARLSLEPKGGPIRLTRPLLAALALLAVLVTTGCGEKKEVLEPKGSKQLELLLDFFPNADHAGIYAAQADGYFKQAGLNLKIRKPADPAAPIKDVASGRVDLAISYEPEVLRARDKGLHVIAVGALVRGPLTSIISLPKAKVSRPRDLEGKTVGTAGIDYQTAYLQTILDDAGVSPSSVTE